MYPYICFRSGQIIITDSFYTTVVQGFQKLWGDHPLPLPLVSANVFIYSYVKKRLSPCTLVQVHIVFMSIDPFKQQPNIRVC